jgi:hypothetical protein
MKPLIFNLIISLVFNRAGPISAQSGYYYWYNDLNQPACAVGEQTRLYCFNSVTWQQVIISLSPPTNLTNLLRIDIKLTKPITLTGDLDIQKAFASNPPTTANMWINIHGVTGIDVNNWPLDSYANYSISLSFSASIVRFFTGNQPSDHFDCTSKLLAGKNETSTFFNYFAGMQFNDYDSFTHLVCPYLLHNAYLSYLILHTYCTHMVWWLSGSSRWFSIQ